MHSRYARYEWVSKALSGTNDKKITVHLTTYAILESSLIRILHVYPDLSPINVHRAVEEGTVEHFELQKLELGKILSYVEP